MSVSERRAWLETPAGRLHQAMGCTGEVDHDAVDARVEEVRRHHARTYGRELSESELAAVRVGAELRSVAAAAQEVPASVPELVQRVNSATVTAGWSYVPEFRRGEGIAMRGPDGAWQGDPKVIAAAEAAEEAKRRQAEASYEAWRNGPAILRTIARPS